MIFLKFMMNFIMMQEYFIRMIRLYFFDEGAYVHGKIIADIPKKSAACVFMRRISYNIFLNCC